ncbi:HAD family hydrolase [Paenibacillus radicis (ex Gao et al. 2016)]|uniref:Haloacid dehalogenase n=1 Tax=Paenibacillus radicis (ex Gao et al. 2016) TaxID=1737354 RepID=A0A917LYJ7_9BACL|nr:HAD family hydrolase [Paenibacillus radicis (ex Gao et al. 2016)]GGG66315.1 haloacid dehalogenase [Paenibacillus radicis (ex Gao et al. 2016)]
MVKAIIFDFDGTILDTETAWYYAFRDAYKKHGVELSLELYSSCIGTSNDHFNPYDYLATEHGIQFDKQTFKEAIHLEHTAMMEREQIRPGIRELLERAKAEGLRIGLASSSSYEWVDKYLNLLGIRDYFECIRTSDHVAQVKPDPELYLQALEALGVEANEAIAIEDSPNGARAAIAAGMHCVVVPNELTKTLAFDAAPRYYHADSLAEVDWNQFAASSR